MLISLTEYAKIHNRALTSAREMAQRGSFKTAQKIGRDWVIDSEEPYPDNRINTGKYKKTGGKATVRTVNITTREEVRAQLGKIFSDRNIILPSDANGRTTEYVDAATDWAMGAQHGDTFEVVHRSGIIEKIAVVRQ